MIAKSTPEMAPELCTLLLVARIKRIPQLLQGVAAGWHRHFDLTEKASDASDGGRYDRPDSMTRWAG